MSEEEFFNATNINIDYSDWYSYILDLEDLFEEIRTKYNIVVLKINIQWHDDGTRPSIDITQWAEQLK